MRYLIWLFLFVVPSFAAESTCVILKNHVKKTAEAFMRWTVEGGFPKGFKFHSEIDDKQIRKIKEQGGQVVIIKPDYALADLQDARKQCESPAEKAPAKDLTPQNAPPAKQ